MQALKMH